MNLVFDKNTLRVVSLFDNVIMSESDNDVLRSMFPSTFDNISIWSVDAKISQNPVHLSIRLDKYHNPEAIVYKNRPIYVCTEDDKKKILDKRLKEKERFLSGVLPKNLVRSLESGIIKLWLSSPYTLPSTSQSLRTLDHFFEKKILPVSWWGMFTDAGGYANMNRSFVYRLHNYHIFVKTEDVPSINQISQWGQYHIHKLSSLDFRKYKRYPKIYGLGPQAQTNHNGRKIFFTMMETDTLHPTFRDTCNLHADEVWVPSSHNKRVFEESGMKKPIYLMPLGIDETIYSNKTNLENGAIPNEDLFFDILGKPHKEGINSFRFLTLFGWSYRKGIDILIQSFIRAFRGADNVVLLIVSTHVGPEHVLADVSRYCKMVRSSDYPQILFYPHVTPEENMPSIYKMGHAFIHTSRGEGFSLPQIEAAACDLPVISCNNTGMSEYLTDDNAYLIKSFEQEICSPEMHWISPFYHGQMFPKLGEAQIEQAVRHMRHVVNHYSEAKVKGNRLKDLVFDKYTWRTATERVARRIRDIYQEN